MHETGREVELGGGMTVIIADIDNSFSCIYACQIWPNEQNLEKGYDALYTHSLVWNFKKKFVIFQSAATKKNKGHACTWILYHIYAA